MKPVAITAVYEHLIREAQRAEAEDERLSEVRFAVNSSIDKATCISCSAFFGEKILFGQGHTPAAALKNMKLKLPTNEEGK